MNLNLIKRLLITLLILTVNPFYSLALEKERIKQEYVTLAIPGTLNAMNFYLFEVGRKKGIYIQEGINLEIVMMKGSAITMALVGGSIDYVGGALQPLRAALTGSPIKLVITGGRREPTWLVSRPEIRSVQDLKGKRIAVSSYMDTEYLGTRDIVRHFGLDPEKDIILVTTGPGVKEQTLLAGAVDAAVTNFANIDLLRKRGFRELVKDMAEFSGYLRGLGQALGVRQEKLKRNENQVKRMIRAQLRSVVYCRDNRKEIIDYMYQNWGWEKDRGREFHDLFLKILPKNFSTPDKDAFEKQIELEKQAGIKIAPGFNLSQFLDLTLVKEVEKELGLAP